MSTPQPIRSLHLVALTVACGCDRASCGAATEDPIELPSGPCEVKVGRDTPTIRVSKSQLSIRPAFGEPSSGAINLARVRDGAVEGWQPDEWAELPPVSLEWGKVASSRDNPPTPVFEFDLGTRYETVLQTIETDVPGSGRVSQGSVLIACADGKARAVPFARSELSAAEVEAAERTRKTSAAAFNAEIVWSEDDELYVRGHYGWWRNDGERAHIFSQPTAIDLEYEPGSCQFPKQPQSWPFDALRRLDEELCQMSSGRNRTFVSPPRDATFGEALRVLDRAREVFWCAREPELDLSLRANCGQHGQAAAANEAALEWLRDAAEVAPSFYVQ